MAKLIDRASLWLFTSFSALFMMMILTRSNLHQSLFASFLLVSGLHVLSKKLPVRQSLSRQRRIRIIQEKLHFWTINIETQALSEIRTLLPDLFTDDQWPSVHLFQQFPDSGKLDANQLLALWKSHRNEKYLCLLSTCKASPETAFLIQELKNPSIKLYDSKELTHKLLPIAAKLPTQSSEKKRCRHALVRIAQMVQSIHPLRSGLYFAFFVLMYRLTGLGFHLFSSVLFLIQIIIFLYFRMRKM